MKLKMRLLVWGGLVLAGVGLWLSNRAPRTDPPDCGGGGVCCPIVPGISTLTGPANAAVEGGSTNAFAAPRLE